MPPSVATSTPAAVGELAHGLFVSVMAMFVVFAVLAVIAVLMHLLGSLATYLERRRSVEASPPTTSVRRTETEDIDAATVAAVTAAVAMVLRGKRFRIASLAGYDVQTARWAMAGRQRLLKKG